MVLPPGITAHFQTIPKRPSARLGDLTSVGRLLMTLGELIQQFANECQIKGFPNSKRSPEPAVLLRLVSLTLLGGGGDTRGLLLECHSAGSEWSFLPREGISKRRASELAAISSHVVFQIAAIFFSTCCFTYTLHVSIATCPEGRLGS